MTRKTTAMLVLVGFVTAAGGGCADTLFGLGDLLGDAGSGIGEIEHCFTPLEPLNLDEVFDKAAAVQWNGDSADLTDAVQPDVAAYYAEHLAADVVPAYYLNERFFALGPLTAGELLELETLSDLVSHAWLYDADLIMEDGRTHDFEGHRRTLAFPIRRDTGRSFLRLNFHYLSETGAPVARLTRGQRPAPSGPRAQTVVLNFSGQAATSFRSGDIKPADVGAVDDPAVRERAVGAFREAFAGLAVTVLTNDDPPPPEPFSVLHVGPADPPLEALGYAENIDYFNAVPDDVAIVDLNSTALQLMRVLAPADYGAAIGKVAAHEMGHLLGLHHVLDADALMTGGGCRGTGLDPQRMIGRRFMCAPAMAFTTGFSIGYQDAEAYLLEVLGPAEE